VIRSLQLATILLLAATTAIQAAPATDKAAPLAHSQSSIMLNYFVDFCVGAYPNTDSWRAAVKSAGFKPGNAADSAVLLDKAPGEVWILVAGDITYYAGINSPPDQICTLASNFDQPDSSIETVFTTVVSGVLGSIGKGDLAPAQMTSRAAPNGGTVKLWVSPLNSPDFLPQVFVNALLTQPGHAIQTRFMRAFTHPK